MICELNDLEPEKYTQDSVIAAIKERGKQNFEYGRIDQKTGRRQSMMSYGFRTPNPYLKQAILQADKYLNGNKSCRGGDVYLMTKEGLPYMQMAATPDEPQIMNVENDRIIHASAAVRYIFYKMIPHVPEPLQVKMKDAIKAGENRDKRQCKTQLENDEKIIPQMIAAIDSNKLRAWLTGRTWELFGRDEPIDEDFPFSELSPELRKEAVGVVMRAYRFPDTLTKFLKVAKSKCGMT